MFSKYSRFAALSIFLLALMIFSFSATTFAQLDPTFGTNGVVTETLGIADVTLANTVLPDGKILIAAAGYVNNQQKLFLIKYNSNGTLDAAHGTNGIIQAQLPFFNLTAGRIQAAARQPDGKIVVVGFDYFGSDVRPLVARLNEDGSLDTSFAGGSGIARPDLNQSGTDRFHAVLIQPDGKILIAGGSTVTDSTYPNLCLARYLSNGSLDTGFGGTGTGYIFHTSRRYSGFEGGEFLYLQSGGKIISANLSEHNGSPDQRRGTVRRFNADGTEDNSFAVLSFPGFNVLQTVFVQPDDKILVGSQFTKTESLERTHTESRIARYNADGSVDSGFGSNGQVTLDVASFSGDFPKGFQVMPDGQILVALNINIVPNRSLYRGSWLALARLSANGAVNGKFLVTPTNGNFVSYMTVLPDAKILTAVRGTNDSSADGVKLVRSVGVPLQNYLFQGIPFDFPSSLYAATDPAVYRPSANSLHFYPSINLSPRPAPGDVLAPADFIGNFEYELTYFRPSTGTWHIVRDFWGAGTNILTVRWGADGDLPVPADFNGDGKADPAVFRPADGYWYIYHIADGTYSIVKWGIDGDKPVVGDYDGDGISDRAVFRPATGEWWILRSGDGGYTRVQFGLEGDIPVQEDYDGDGKFDIAVYRPSNGVWYRINSADASFFAFQWGLPGDVPVPGNYDNDQKANVAVWRPANGGWFIVNPDYATMHDYTLGMNGDRPLPAKY